MCCPSERSEPADHHCIAALDLNRRPRARTRRPDMTSGRKADLNKVPVFAQVTLRRSFCLILVQSDLQTYKKILFLEPNVPRTPRSHKTGVQFFAQADSPHVDICTYSDVVAWIAWRSRITPSQGLTQETVCRRAPQSLKSDSFTRPACQFIRRTS